MKLFAKHDRLPYVIAIAWLALTVTLAVWWLVVGLRLAAASQAGAAANGLFPLHNVKRMLLSEGGVFVALLVGGGVALLVAIAMEHKRRRAVETFFIAFTHDLKTALASLLLQAESLKEDLPAAAASPHVDGLLRDVARLQLQLENSLHVAQPDGTVFLEPIDVRQAVNRIALDLADLEVTIDGDARIHADARALDAILRNLLQNAGRHGGATQVGVGVESEHNGLVRVTVRDNGTGAPAETLRLLGQPFASAKGTGVGLFVSRKLIERMGGRLTFGTPASDAGFTVYLEFQKARS